MTGSGPVAASSPDGSVLHLQYGPIDLLITAEGPVGARRQAFAAAEAAFRPVLDDLVAELPLLRTPRSQTRHGGYSTPSDPMSDPMSEPVSDLALDPAVVGPVARRMVAATAGFGSIFITPMAAVAGAVADFIVAEAMNPALSRLVVNNGGDIAFALFDAAITVGLMGPATDHRLSGAVTITAADPVRGVATSGWRGRSHSLGIADAVTVLAADAATADAAASVIASAVDLPGHPLIDRRPATELQEDSDLGDLLVTVDVGELSRAEQQQAIEPGRALAELLLDERRIVAAFIVVGEQWSATTLPGAGSAGAVWWASHADDADSRFAFDGSSAPSRRRLGTGKIRR